MSSKSKVKAFCYTRCPAQTAFQRFQDPPLCPAGYKEGNYGKTCANATDGFGLNWKCECTNWMTCAQRSFGNFFGCHQKRTPKILFKVRECIQSRTFYIFVFIT